MSKSKVPSNTQFVKKDTLRFPLHLLRDPSLPQSVRVRMFYEAYGTMNDWCWVSPMKIALICDLSAAQVTEVRKRFVKSGVLEFARHEPTAKGWKHKYRIATGEDFMREPVEEEWEIIHSVFGAYKFESSAATKKPSLKLVANG